MRFLNRNNSETNYMKNLKIWHKIVCVFSNTHSNFDQNLNFDRAIDWFFWRGMSQCLPISDFFQPPVAGSHTRPPTFFCPRNANTHRHGSLRHARDLHIKYFNRTGNPSHLCLLEVMWPSKTSSQNAG
jgi:hypothetical protein